MFLQRNVENQILEKAQSMFHQFCFNKVSIDQISSKLGISKKTFYKYYESKESLVLRIIESNIRDVALQINKLHSSSKISYHEKMEKLMSITMDFHDKFSEIFMQDIVKYMPDIINKFEESRKVLIRDNFIIFLKQGVNDGIFKKDFDVNIFINLYFHIIHKIHDPETLANSSFSIKDLHQMIIKIMFEGILTNKARKELQGEQAA